MLFIELVPKPVLYKVYMAYDVCMTLPKERTAY